MLFQNKSEKVLEGILIRMKNNVSNNYKDAAQENFREYKDSLQQFKEQGLIKGKHLAHYETVLAEYEEQLKKFTHKDQPTRWGHWEQKP